MYSLATPIGPLQPISRTRLKESNRWLPRVQRMATLLDSAWRVPGTRFRFGIDTLIGLIPGAGDIVSAGLSGYMLWQAQRHGASKGTLLRMTGNVLLDLTVGCIPLVGDLFDAMWKANQRNARILEREFGAGFD